MKNLLYTAILFIFTINVAIAQSNFVVFAPPTVIAAPDEHDVVADGYVQNTTATTLNLKWDRLQIQVPTGMRTQICDVNLCYFHTVSTRNFDLDPFETGDLLVHFLNDVQEPMDAIVHVKITNLNDTTETQTGIFTYSSTVTGTGSPIAANVKLFPNPTTESFSLENADGVAAIRVFSMDGRQVNFFNVSASNSYSLAAQVAGTYILGLVDTNGHLVQAIELQKQ